MSMCVSVYMRVCVLKYTRSHTTTDMYVCICMYSSTRAHQIVSVYIRQFAEFQ